MIRQLIRYTVYFIFLIFLQVTILNNINFLGNINPYIYVIFILTLPLSLSKSWVLLLAFAMGFILDLFAYTPGINTAALVFLGFTRNALLPFIAPRDGFEPGSIPSASQYGWGWYLRYSAILIFLHHTCLFFLDAFSFHNFGNILKNILYSAIFTMLLAILTQSNRSKIKIGSD